MRLPSLDAGSNDTALLNCSSLPYRAPPPCAGVKVRPCGCCATLTPLVVVAFRACRAGGGSEIGHTRTYIFRVGAILNMSGSMQLTNCSVTEPKKAFAMLSAIDEICLLRVVTAASIRGNQLTAPYYWRPLVSYVNDLTFKVDFRGKILR
jgi:hypothetical protein